MISYVYFQVMRKILKGRKVEHTVYGKKINDIERGNQIIRRKLEEDNPCMVARIGSVEMQAINAVYAYQMKVRKNIPEIYGKGLNRNAGFFPSNNEAMQRFALCYQEAAKQLDVAAVLLNRDEDYFYRTYAPDIEYVELCSLEPYYVQAPWSVALKGKKVLVIHPFAATIEKQYKKRKELFANQDVLPEFDLITIQAVQTIGKNTAGFDSWFDALDYMKCKMKAIDFDVALIGCGAYSFPLAAYAKQLGKKSVVVGGALQILFGIKGKRWDDAGKIKELYNEAWTRPSEEERPVGAEDVESGCYW